MKVYIVTDGCYSDYGIEAVFTDDKKAKLYCAAHESDDMRIEEYDTENNEIITEKPVLKCWHVPVDESGPYFYNLQCRYTFQKYKKVEKNYFSKHAHIYLSLPENKTKEQAIKAISDFYAQWKAEQQGIV